jgi:hypothetical protein
MHITCIFVFNYLGKMVTYTIFFGDVVTGRGISFSTSNKRTLSEKAGVGYENLLRVFTRERRNYWVSPKGYIILKSEVFYKGRSRNRSSTNFSQ